MKLGAKIGETSVFLSMYCRYLIDSCDVCVEYRPIGCFGKDVAVLLFTGVTVFRR